MKNNHSKISIAIAVLIEIFLIITAIFQITSSQFKNAMITLLVIICMLFPFFITRIANKKKIMLPSSFELITLLFILFTLYFGDIHKFYSIFWWWDLFLHAMAGSYAVIVAFHIIQGIIIKEKEISERRFIVFSVIFSFCFSITLGTLWEMVEFVGDYLFKTNMVKGGLKDTATDLLIKILFAFITSIICYYRKIKTKDKL